MDSSKRLENILEELEDILQGRVNFNKYSRNAHINSRIEVGEICSLLRCLLEILTFDNHSEVVQFLNRYWLELDDYELRSINDLASKIHYWKLDQQVNQ